MDTSTQERLVELLPTPEEYERALQEGMGLPPAEANETARTVLTESCMEESRPDLSGGMQDWNGVYKGRFYSIEPENALVINQVELFMFLSSLALGGVSGGGALLMLVVSVLKLSFAAYGHQHAAVVDVLGKHESISSGVGKGELRAQASTSLVADGYSEITDRRLSEILADLEKARMVDEHDDQAWLRKKIHFKG